MNHIMILFEFKYHSIQVNKLLEIYFNIIAVYEEKIIIINEKKL
jgi:hypothetical protein